MRVIDEVRLLRLQQLYEEFGSYAELNKRLGLSSRDSTLNQIAKGSPNSRTRKPRSMGSDLARRLEAATGKPSGWMDNDPELDAAWPFPMVNQLAWNALPPEAKVRVQKGMLALLAQYADDPADVPPASGTTLVTGSGEHSLRMLHEPIGKPYRAGGK